MNRKASKVAKPRRQESERDLHDERDNQQDQGRGRDRERSDKSDFVNLTKLFESRNNQDILLGTMSEEYLDRLEGLLADARDSKKGITFFVMLNGKWGPSLTAALSRDRQEGGGYGRGNFDNGNRHSGSSGSRRNRWR